MKSIERRFKRFATKNPLWSSYICFASAVANQRFKKSTIHRWFYKLVDKDDYSNKEKKEILKHLCDLSNMPEDDKKRG